MDIRIKIVDAIVAYIVKYARHPKAIVIKKEQLSDVITGNYYSASNFMTVGSQTVNIGTIYGVNLYVSTDKCLCGIKLKGLPDEHKLKCLPYLINGIQDSIWLGDIDDGND